MLNWNIRMQITPTLLQLNENVFKETRVWLAHMWIYHISSASYRIHLHNTYVCWQNCINSFDILFQKFFILINIIRVTKVTQHTDRCRFVVACTPHDTQNMYHEYFMALLHTENVYNVCSIHMLFFCIVKLCI